MQKLSLLGECALVNRVTELPFNPLVEVALSAIAEWVSIYRYTIGCLHNEFGLCEPDEVMRMAKEMGLTPCQLSELASEGPGTANLLKNMLVALHVDPKVVANRIRSSDRNCSGCVSPVVTRSDASMSLPREQPPIISENFAPMQCRSTNYSIRMVSRPEIN